MGTKRREFKSGFKAKVALEAIKESKTLAQLAVDFSLHPHQISQWKQTLLTSIEKVFEEEKAGRTSKADEKQAIEKEKSRLYEQIGKLQMEVEWLKKNIRLSKSKTFSPGRARMQSSFN